MLASKKLKTSLLHNALDFAITVAHFFTLGHSRVESEDILFRMMRCPLPNTKEIQEAAFYRS